MHIRLFTYYILLFIGFISLFFRINGYIGVGITYGFAIGVISIVLIYAFVNHRELKLFRFLNNIWIKIVTISTLFLSENSSEQFSRNETIVDEFVLILQAIGVLYISGFVFMLALKIISSMPKILKNIELIFIELFKFFCWLFIVLISFLGIPILMTLWAYSETTHHFGSFLGVVAGIFGLLIGFKVGSFAFVMANAISEDLQKSQKLAVSDYKNSEEASKKIG